jgi:hypothetical protein
MTKMLAALLAALALVLTASPASAQSEWDGVERVVVIGDLHGDYAKFADILQDARLTDGNGDWIGGTAHLVQLGDVPDRAPDTRRILDELMRLERQARRAGGFVHALIGNHEAMNVEGDLRYTTAGEFAAFADRGSVRRREQYFQRTLDYLRANPPAQGMPVLDDAFRAQWEASHPLGYVEHREAWAPSGAYGRWISGHDAVIRINDTLYMHAGLGPSFASADRSTLNDAVRAALRGRPLPAYGDILTNEEGPLWYRGLALNPEPSERALVEALLARHGVNHVVVGHTKRASTIFPRFGGSVILTDIAVPSGYADPRAYLIQDNGEFIAVHRGHRIPLTATTPAEICAYLTQVAAFDHPGGPVAALVANCSATAN